MRTLVFLASLPIFITPSLAKDLPKDAVPITDSEQIEILSGKTINGIFFGKNGKQAGTWVAEWKDDGSKNVTVSVKGKKPISKTLKWFVKDGKFCEERFSNKKLTCGTEGTYFKSGNTCFTTLPKKKTVSNEFPC